MLTRPGAPETEPTNTARPATGIQALPDDLLARVLVHLPSIRDFGRADCVCRAWHVPGSPIEQALRMRIMARGGKVPAALPAGAASLTQRLCWQERLHTERMPDVIAAGLGFSVATHAPGGLCVWGKLFDGIGSDEPMFSSLGPTWVQSLHSVR